MFLWTWRLSLEKTEQDFEIPLPFSSHFNNNNTNKPNDYPPPAQPTRGAQFTYLRN